jgi:hypothetical protein
VSAENVNSVVIKLVCEHCGEVASLRMTPELALDHVSAVTAAATGMPRLEDLEPGGQG